MVRPSIEVVHVGASSRDVTPDDPRGWRLGGGVTYAALATARLGLRTAAVIGLDPLARDAHELGLLRDAGIELLVVPLEAGPVFVNEEHPDGRVQTAVEAGLPIEPVPVPSSWLEAPGWAFVPVADEVPDAWASVPGDEAIVAVGWQGMLRKLASGARVERIAPRPRALLERADLVGVSRHDVDPSTELSVLTGLLKPGARLLVTHGSDGGLLITVGDSSVLRYLPTSTDDEIDPTGAGDTFLAALFAATVRPSLLGLSRGIGAPLRFAAAAGSLAVEGIGLAGVPDLAAVQVRRVRERVRRAVLPSLAAQVGQIDVDA